MPMVSANGEYFGLDRAAPAWDRYRMPRATSFATPRCSRRPLGQAPTLFARRPPGGAAVLVLLAFIALLGALFACRGHEGEDGAGGQSGDEGRTPRGPWLGTGGVAAELPAPRP